MNLGENVLRFRRVFQILAPDFNISKALVRARSIYYYFADRRKLAPQMERKTKCYKTVFCLYCYLFKHNIEELYLTYVNKQINFIMIRILKDFTM